MFRKVLFVSLFGFIACAAFLHGSLTDRQGSVTVRVTDTDTGAPLQDALVTIVKMYRPKNRFLFLEGYPSKTYPAQTAEDGQVILHDVIIQGLESGAFSGHISVKVPGYICLRQELIDPIPTNFEIKLKKEATRENAPVLDQGYFDFYPAGNNFKHVSAPWDGNDKVRFGFNFHDNAYSTQTEEADFILSFRIFPDEPTSRPLVKNSRLPSYTIVPVETMTAGSTSGKRVKYAWTIEAGHGGKLIWLPGTQFNAFYELDECNFPISTDPIDLFPVEPVGFTRLSNLFCVQNARGEVIKFKFDPHQVRWIKQKDGTNRVRSAISNRHLQPYCF